MRRLICYGDSNTYGFDPCSPLGVPYPPEHTWPGILEMRRKEPVLNWGRNGRTVPTAGEWLPKVHREDRVLVMLGTNDLLMGRSAEAAGAAMESLLDRLNCQTVLLAPPPLGFPQLQEALDRLTQIYQVLAEQRGLLFGNPQLWELPLCFDGIHLTREAHGILGLRTAELLQVQEEDGKVHP